jgi:hypothetical protein
MNAINDYVETEKKHLKEYPFFYIYANDTGKYYSVTIEREIKKVWLYTEDNISFSYKDFPTVVILKDGKFFMWKDSSIELSDSIIQTLYQNNIVDTANTGRYTTIIPEHTIRDGDYDPIYFFCKQNVSIYRKVYPKDWTYKYKIPKLKCK